MIRIVALIAVCCSSVFAGYASDLRIEAGRYAGRTAILYRYADYFTMRPEVVSVQTINDSGIVNFNYNPGAIELLQLKIGYTVADFFVEPESTYHIRIEEPAKTEARTISGSTKVNPLFIGLDRFDINALLTDMNGHLDGFLAREYMREKATDQESAHEEHMSSPLKDSVSVIRSRKTDRIDTLEKKLMNYYSEVDHPFFKQQLEYAVAQLRITPDCNRSKLFEASIKGRDIQYQSPEYVKFFKQFFHKHLLQFAFTKQPEMVQAAVKSGDFEQVLALMREHEFLHDEELAELVTLHELYLEWGNDLLSSQGIIRCLDYNSFNETLQTIAENMLWDRTEMQVGARLPDNLEPLGYDGRSVDASVLDSGYVYFAVTADWCTYCEQEINALEDLAEQYGNYVHFVVLDIATEVKEDDIGRRERASSSITEIHAGGDPLILDKLRIRSVPTFYLLLNGIIQQAPAVAPSQGIGREFHRITTAAKKGEKVKVWDN